MPKNLRPGENVSFLQTRAPAVMWRYVKTVAINTAKDGTVTRLCTDNIIEFLGARRWERGLPWLRPLAQDGVYRGMTTGFVQVNLPLSNMDADGESFVTYGYLKRHKLLDLVEKDKFALEAVLTQVEAAPLLRLVADQLGIPGAVLGYTFIDWLAVHKYTPAAALEAQAPAVGEHPAHISSPTSRFSVRPKAR